MRQFTWDILDANSWLMIEGKSGLLFDPVDSRTLYGAVAGLTELLIVLTHCHYDHIGGLNHIRAMKPGARVLSTSACSERIGSPGGNLSNVANAFMAFHNHSNTVEDLVTPFSCAAADWTFEGLLDTQWQGHALKLREYNGHARGSLCCEIDGSLLVTGDTLLPLPTVTRLPGGSTRRFREEDLPRLEAMRGRIRRVYPGHGQPGRLEDMLRLNTEIM